MPVSSDSRFSGLPILSAQFPDGSNRQVLGQRWDRIGGGAPAASHVITQGETIDAIAQRYYGGAGVWWQILDANPLVFPMDLQPGDKLAIPGPNSATRVVRARRF